MIKTANISVQGMHCASCAGKIEKALSKMPGVSDAVVLLALARLRVVFDDTVVSLVDVLETVKYSGFEAQVIPAGVSAGLQAEAIRANNERDKKRYKRAFQASALLSLLLVYFMAQGGVHSHAVLAVQAVLSGLAQIIGLRMFYRGAVAALRSGDAGMDALVAVATTISYLYSVWAAVAGGHAFFETSALLIAFVLFGKWLENKARADASEALLRLMSGAARQAEIVRGEGTSFIEAEALLPGDIYILKAGAVASADGIIVSGIANFDESMLSGEHLPVEKTEGLPVYSGSLDCDGVVQIQVTSPAADSMLEKIAAALLDAQAGRPRIQRLADRVVAKFSLTVAILAVITFVLWLFWFGEDLSVALTRAVAVMVVACPCAIGLATPLAVAAATGSLLGRGIVIREGEVFERAAKVDVVMFDKTGTLTQKTPMLADVVLYNDVSKEDALHLAAILGRASAHPLAQALAVDIKPATICCDVREYAGRGVSAAMDGKKYFLGSSRYADEVLGDGYGVLPDVARVYLFSETEVLAGFIFEERLEEDVLQALQELAELNIKPVIASGDRSDAVARIAKECGIDEYYAELSPGEKAELVRSLQKNGHRIAVCGDGINDAVALRQADVGIAVKGGADTAKLSAGVNVIRGGVSFVAYFMKVSRAVTRNIKQNLAWALIYNTVMLPVAMLLPVSPVYCGLAMSLSSVSVALNALRLRAAIR